MVDLGRLAAAFDAFKRDKEAQNPSGSKVKEIIPEMGMIGKRSYPVHFCKNIRGSDISEPRQGRGDSAALRETTRRPIQALIPKTKIKSDGGQAANDRTYFETGLRIKKQPADFSAGCLFVSAGP